MGRVLIRTVRAAFFTGILLSGSLLISVQALANTPFNIYPPKSAVQAEKSPFAAPFGPAEDTGPLSPPKKLVAITFDDGPGPHTGDLLDELKERGAKATFFIFAQKITPENTPLIKRMDADGHCIGSHTYSHTQLTLLTNEEIYQEVKKADEAIAEIIGYAPKLLRPPFGSYDKRIIEACGKPMILWSVDTRDWQVHDPNKVCRRILDTVQDGDIVLLHDLKASSKDGVIAAIDVMLDEGYSFVTVPELFESRGIPLVSGSRYYKAYMDTVNSYEEGGV